MSSFSSTRRAWLGGAAALAASLATAGGADAQIRRRQLLEEFEEDDLYWSQPRRSAPRRAPADGFYERQVQEDYYRPGSRQGDPYSIYRDGPDPYGQDADGQDGYRPRRGRQGSASEPLGTALSDGGFDYRRIYAAVEGEPYPVPAFNFLRVRPEFLRRVVAYSGREPPGTIVVDPHARHLFLVEGGGRAVRYGVGVGRQGFAWSGAATINSKQAWPDWYPPKEMIARDPKLARQLTELRSGIGMHGGPGNPLGARALYLWQGGRDTLYRIHGTTEPWTIGASVSSGCIRMVNQDAIDLHDRVGVGASVAVLA